MTESREAYLERINSAPMSAQLSTRAAHGSACPRCGSVQFKVRRRMSTKVGFGPLSLLGQAKHVRCVRCNLELDRR